MRKFFGAGVGALAAGAAVVFAVTSTSTPAEPSRPQPQASAPVIESELVSLATKLSSDDTKLPGDATLVKQTVKDGNGAGVTYTLYTDEGVSFSGGSKESLTASAKKGEDEGDGVYAREGRAAVFAADGDLEEARIRMVDAAPNDWGLGKSDAERQKIWDKARERVAEEYYDGSYQLPENPPSGAELEKLVGNRLWINGMNAMSLGAADPQIRAGVLRLYSSVDAITVKRSTDKGHDSLTVTAGSSLFDGSGSEVLKVDAYTGMPISSWTVKDGKMKYRTAYDVSRVRLGDVTSGGF